MFRKKDVKETQYSFTSAVAGLTPDQQKKLMNSWAGLFFEEVYSKIDESIFSVLYSEAGSRPNKPARLLVAALCLKEIFQLNDEQLVEQIEWNRQFQYALGIQNSSDFFDPRTLTRFRTKLASYEMETGKDLVHEAIKGLLNNFNEQMETDRSVRRVDSFQVESNIKKLPRLQLIYETNRVCVAALNKAGVEIPELLEHYLKDDDSNQIFYHDTVLSREQKAVLLIMETRETRKLLKSVDVCQDKLELLERLISDHMIEEEGELRLKKNKSEGMNSQVLQSPHDPDATFREKKGQHRGYSANIEECACEDGSMIEDYQYEQNIHSDSEFMKDMIDKEEYHPLENPLMIITDGAYASIENQQKAKDKGIIHVPTELVGRKTDDICADFILNKEGTKVVKCPNGNKPDSCSYYPQTGMCRAVFNREICENCPRLKECHPKLLKTTAAKIVSSKSVARAKIKRSQTGEAFNEHRKFRNGSEAVPSVMRQKFKVDRMPVRGLVRTRQLFGFKIGALAFTKYQRFLERRANRLKKCA